MSNKRTLDSFFAPKSAKNPRIDSEEKTNHSVHGTYPFPVAGLPLVIKESLGFAPATEGRVINDQPDLDLLYFQPYIPKEIERSLFDFLRDNLFFYRVKYTIKRGSIETNINTPRFTTVLGVDDTSYFSTEGALLDSKSNRPINSDRYQCEPRPIPECLDELRKITEGSTGHKYNFCLVNYYASGNDSISYHSDDERFLGKLPAIASFSLGAKRDFLMKHKPIAPPAGQPEPKPLKLALGSGDMILMRGPTQANWLHSIPKRKGGESDRGRINITFRFACVRGGTENYYKYNVGNGEVFRWDRSRKEMIPWTPNVDETK